MKYDELISLIVSSTHEDWLHDDSRGIFTLKRDLDVTIRELRTEPGAREPFAEEWATRHPNPEAYSEQYELWYRCSFVKVYFFVVVDGGRALIPYPKAADNLTITREQFAVADAVNPSGFRRYFDEYTKRFKIEG